MKKPRWFGSGLQASFTVSMSRSAHAEATPFDAHKVPQWSPSHSMYGMPSFWYASNSRSSQASLVFASAGALAMIGTSSAMALFTAVPMEPDELSTCSSAGDTRSRKTIAPSAASTASFFATFLISATACLILVIAGCDLQPKA
ncbi:MAG: hypothetical protein HY698_08610 [Deltaproteobacteria bacterium]|nr:hypothetical protein [Deltaproteobacteria bacterium]